MANIASLPKGLLGAAKGAFIGDTEQYLNTAYSTEMTERKRRRDNSGGRIYAGIAPDIRATREAALALNPLAFLAKAKNAVLSIGHYDAARTR